VADFLGPPLAAGERLLHAGLNEHGVRVIEDRRVYRAGVHDVDPDATRCQLERRRPSDAKTETPRSSWPVTTRRGMEGIEELRIRSGN
jgi:hypothetical protein